MFFVFLGALGLCLPAHAQLGADCTASLLGRTAQVNDDGSFFLSNIPAEPGLHRVRVTCSPDGGLVTRGQSALFDIDPTVLIIIGPIAFGTVDPIPVALDVDAPTTTLSQAGEEVQLTVTGILADGSLVDMTAGSGGTVYLASDKRVAEVDGNGLVTAKERGAVVVSVRREGVVGSIRIDVAIPNDADGDGMTDEFEVANDLDPNNPTDALEDLDGDGLTNLEEFQRGTSIAAADTDGDGLTDRDEITRGTPPADPDADDDGLLDGFEVERGLNALAADTDNDSILDGVEVVIGTDPLVPNATTTLTGAVQDASGAVVDGAAAVALGRITATTNQSGRFTLTGVPADVGALTVYSRLIRVGKVLDGSSAPVTPVAGGSTDVGVISLAQVSGVVTGTVRDPHGEPVPDARVTVINGIDRREANADVTGVFQLDRLPPGPIEVRALDPRTSLRGRSFGELAGLGSAVVDVKLSASADFVGTVFTRDLVTPAGEGVAVEARRSVNGGVIAQEATEASGRYRLAYLPLGGYVLDAVLGAPPTGEHGRTTSALTFTSQVVQADIGFLGKGLVTGRVERADGTAAAGAEVTIGSRGVFNQSLETVTGADGSFTVSGVFVGSFGAFARSTTAPESGATSGEIRFDGDTDDVLITLGGIGSIVGTVFEPDGTTVVPGAGVSGFGATTADGAGAYRFDQVPVGETIKLLAGHPGSNDCARGEAVVPSQDATVVRDLVMQGFGGLEITVLYADGSPAVGATVGVAPKFPTCGGGGGGEVDSFGRLSLPGLNVGPHDLYVAEPLCGISVQSGATVGLGETRQVTVTLPAFGEIAGTVFAPDGITPVPGIRVEAAGQRTNSGPTGGFRFQCVKEGNHTLVAKDYRGEVLARETGVILSTQNQVVVRNLVLIARGNVEGTVLDPNGAAATGVGVSVSSSGGNSRFVRTDVDGFYRAVDVNVGDVRVVARDAPNNFEGRAEGVLTADGETITVDVQMEGDQILAELYDANNYVFPIEYPNGSILEGTLGVYRGDDQDRRGGFVY